MSVPERPPPPPPQIPEYMREDNLTNECRELLSTLPTSSNGSFIGTNLYQYEGFWVVSGVVQGVIRCQKNFEAQDTDTILVTNPKSGTTSLKAMVFALVNRDKYVDCQDQHPLLTTNPHDLVPFLEIILYAGKGDVPDLSTFTSPRLFATHMPVGSLPRSVKDSSCKIVYLCRNPKDMFVSMWHFSNKFRPRELGTNKLEDFFDRFCNGTIAYGSFWDHVMGYWNESLKFFQKVLFLKYEDIQENPTYQLRRLAEFLKCPFSLEEEANGLVEEITRLCSFDHLSNLKVNKTEKMSTGQENHMYFRNGKVGDWDKVLTPEMAKKLDDITEQKMYSLGFKF